MPVLRAACTHSARKRRAWRAGAAALLLLLPWAVAAFDLVSWGDLTIHPKFNTRVGLQHGENINYGRGALDSPGETTRDTLYVSFKPEFTLTFDLDRSEIYGGFSAVAAAVSFGILALVLYGALAFDRDRRRGELHDLLALVEGRFAPLEVEDGSVAPLRRRG